MFRSSPAYSNKAINVYTQYAEAYDARGACYDELKDHNNAVADYNMCQQIKPNYGPAAEALHGDH